MKIILIMETLLVTVSVDILEEMFMIILIDTLVMKWTVMLMFKTCGFVDRRTT